MNLQALLADKPTLYLIVACAGTLLAVILIVTGVRRLHAIFGNYMKLSIEQGRGQEPSYGFPVFLIALGLAMICAALIYLVAKLA